MFRAEPGTVISTPNPVTQQDGVNLEGASYVTIEAFTLTGLPRAGIRTVLNHHVTIRQNTADANGRWGIFSGFSDDLTIEANVATRSVLEHGIYVIGFSFPVVPQGQARIRTQLSAAHTPEQLARAAEAFARVGRVLGIV